VGIRCFGAGPGQDADHVSFAPIARGAGSATRCLHDAAQATGQHSKTSLDEQTSDVFSELTLGSGGVPIADYRNDGSHVHAPSTGGPVATALRRTRPGPGFSRAWQAMRWLCLSPSMRSKSASSSFGGSKHSAPSMTRTSQVAQLALRHEKGTGASTSSQMSSKSPPSGTSTALAWPARLASNSILGTGYM